jgi:hypothetical protein
MIPPGATSEERRRALLGSVASMHEAHERRQTRAEEIQRARIATVGDDPLSRAELAEIAAAVGGQAVRLDDSPTLVVRRGRFLIGETEALRNAGVSVVDVPELERMLESHEAVYRSSALRTACQRAVAVAGGRRMAERTFDPERLVEVARSGGFVTRDGRRAA